MLWDSKEALASEGSLDTAQDDAEIHRILNDWDTFLDPTRVFNDFQAQFQVAQAAPMAEQLSMWAHGKLLWSNVVSPAMNLLLGQMSEKERRRQILRRLPRPADLQPILARFS